MKRLSLVLGLVACLGFCWVAAAVPILPTVAGYKVTAYASGVSPNEMTWGSDGSLYVAPAEPVSGPDQVIKIASGGGATSTFGPIFADPDALVFDTNGAFGIPGSLIVGAGSNGVYRVAPNGVASLLANSGFNDQNAMVIDSSGRLLFTDDLARVNVLPPGGTSSVLFSYAVGASELVIGHDGSLFTGHFDGRIFRHSPTGIFLEEFASGLGLGGERGYQIAADGNRILALSQGSLWSYSSAGVRTLLANGFDPNRGAYADMTVGPDGAIYISDVFNETVLRLEAIPEPTTLALMTLGVAGLGYSRRRHD